MKPTATCLTFLVFFTIQGFAQDHISKTNRRNLTPANAHVDIDTDSGNEIAIKDQASTATASLNMYNNSDEHFQIGKNGTLHSSAPNAAFIWNYGNHPIRFGTDGTERLRIKNNGYLGIGNSDPSAKLHVSKNTTGSSTVYTSIFDDASEASGWSNVLIRAAQWASLTFVQPGAGDDFQFANTGAGLTLYHGMNDFISGFSSVGRWNNPSATYQLTVFGSALAMGGTWVPSDLQLKRDVTESDSFLDKVLDLRTKSYIYQTGDPKWQSLKLPKNPQIGFIAQDVEKVFPSLVKSEMTSTNELNTSTIKAINYAGFVPILSSSIQELYELLVDEQNERTVLASELEELKRENHQIKSKLNLAQLQIKEIEEKLNLISKGFEGKVKFEKN